MGLFDFLKKKDPAYQPVNRLETLFQASFHDELERSKFLNAIFHFDLFVFGSSSLNADGSKTVQLLKVEAEPGVLAVPCYTSVDAMAWYLAHTRQPAQNYLGMSALVFLQGLENGVGMYLNFGHVYLKYFTPVELSEMLNGPKLDAFTIPTGQAIRIGQPAKPPVALIDLVTRYTATQSYVQDIYFGAMESGTPPSMSYLFLLDFVEGTTAKKQEEIIAELGQGIRQIPTDLPIDISPRLPNGSFEGAITAGTLVSLPHP